MPGGEPVLVLCKLLLQSQWRPEVRRRSHQESCEPGRRYSDDVECSAIQHQRSSDDPRIGSELLLPEGPADNDDGKGTDPLIIARRDYPAQGGIHSEQRKEVSGDEFSAHHLAFAGTIPDCLGAISIKGKHALERSAVVAVVGVVRVGER